MPRTTIPAAGGAMPAAHELNRRRLLLGLAAASTAAATVVAPVAVQAALPEMTVRERAIWHLKELERLILADGASEVTVIACGHDYVGIDGVTGCKSISLHPGKRVVGKGGIFAAKGGAA